VGVVLDTAQTPFKQTTVGDMTQAMAGHAIGTPLQFCCQADWFASHCALLMGVDAQRAQ